MAWIRPWTFCLSPAAPGFWAIRRPSTRRCRSSGPAINRIVPSSFSRPHGTRTTRPKNVPTIPWRTWPNVPKEALVLSPLYVRKALMKDAIIEVKDLTRKFGDFIAVNGISFTTQRGQIFGFLGPNGAGKTTSIKMLTTLLIPSSGSILLDGNDPVKEQAKVRRSFGIVFQDPSLDDELTAAENMEFHGVLYKVPPDLRKKRTEELLRIVELWDRRNDLVKKFSG